MNIQTKIRLNKMRSLAIAGQVLEVGINKNKLFFHSKTLDCVKEYKPDILCDLNKSKIPEEDGKFKVIVAGEILEHLQNPYKVLREFHRVLEKDGILIVSVPNVCSLVNRINMLRGKLPTGCSLPEKTATPEKHMNDFNLKTLKQVLINAGFKIEVVTSNGMISKSTLITKFIPASMGESLIIRAKKNE